MTMNVRKFEHISISKGIVPLGCAWLGMSLLVCLFISTTHAQGGPSDVPGTQDAEGPQFQSQLNELITTVYCYCGCNRETIEVCVCGTAERIEADFRNRLLAGQTVEQIRNNYLDTYGPQFYAVMPPEGINLIAYIVPAVILLLIGGIAFAVLRKSKRQPVTTTDGSQQVSGTTLKQVETELDRYKREN